MSGSDNFDSFFKEIAEYTKIPYCVGFGIRNGETAKKMGTYCDGVIVGSAVVDKIGKYQQDALPKIADLCQELKAGLNQQ